VFAHHTRVSLGFALLLATASVAVAQTGSVTLASQGAAADTVPASATPYRVGFTLTNRGADSATYSISCTGLGVAACATAPTDPVRVAAGQQIALAVDYRATRAGRGLVVLRVRDPRTGARASASLLLSVTGS
jgi:hypothetical protein